MFRWQAVEDDDDGFAKFREWPQQRTPFAMTELWAMVLRQCYSQLSESSTIGYEAAKAIQHVVQRDVDTVTLISCLLFSAANGEIEM